MPLEDKLRKIDILFKEWQSYQPLPKEIQDKLWKKLRLEWNYNSNHIEGNTLTYGETELLLIFDKTTGDHELREYEEMKAHDVIIHIIRDWAVDKTRDISEADIRELNRRLLVEPFWKEASTYDGQPTRRLINIGTYKEHPNSVRLKNGEIFHYASPEETPRLMQELMEWYRANTDLPPIILAAEVHYRFVSIHPFDDGNGRLSRLLVNYILMRNGYPPIVIKSTDKEVYLTALQKADTGDRPAFHEYLANQLIWSLGIGIKAAKGESIEEDDDVDKEIDLLKKNLLSKKELITVSRSREEDFRIIKEEIIPLTSEIKKELSVFDDFFLEKNGWIILSNSKSLFKTSKKRYIIPLQGPSATEKIDDIIGTDFELGSFTLQFSWVAFRMIKKSPPTARLIIHVEMEDYFYRIYIEEVSELAVEKLYHIPLTELEKKKLIKEMKKQLLCQIESFPIE